MGSRCNGICFPREIHRECMSHGRNLSSVSNARKGQKPDQKKRARGLPLDVYEKKKTMIGVGATDLNWRKETCVRLRKQNDRRTIAPKNHQGARSPNNIYVS